MAALEGRDGFVRSYLATLEAAGVEAVLCPGQMLPAPPTHVLGTMVRPQSAMIMITRASSEPLRRLFSWLKASTSAFEFKAL